MDLINIITIATMVVTCLHKIRPEVEGVTTNDFAEVVKSKYFIDKTLLIEDVLRELLKIKKSTKHRFLKVLAGPKFGKSTNNNMMKRFLGIQVDENGNILNINKSSNYNLFASGNLTVFKRKKFFDRHFGTYPVISIDFKALREVKSFDSLLYELRKTIKATFKEHEYILRATNLWTHFNKDNFAIFFNDTKVHELHQYNIFCSFSILSKMLYNNFGKPVFVLIDDFDSFEEPLEYVEEKERKKITTFMGVLFSDILLSNKYLFGALLSGSLNLGKLYLKKVSRSDKPYTDIADMSETYNNGLWKYYGISEDELECLLHRFIQDENKLSVAKEFILGNFSVDKNHIGFLNESQPCIVWSVMQYFKNQTKDTNVFSKSVPNLQQ